MAYVYGNALNVSIALIVFGLIQIAMFVSCYFGCHSEFLFDFAAPAWSGLFVSIIMVKHDVAVYGGQNSS